MCRVLRVQRSGFYAWLKRPKSRRAIEDQRLSGLVKQFWLESGCSYGYRTISKDMKDQGESCGKNRVYRIMKVANIRSKRGYKRHKGFKGGNVSMVAPNTHWRLVAAYGAMGIGYIIPATYLPVMAREIVQSPFIFGCAWPMFGVAAFISTLLASRFQNRN